MVKRHGGTQVLSTGTCEVTVEPSLMSRFRTFCTGGPGYEPPPIVRRDTGRRSRAPRRGRQNSWNRTCQGCRRGSCELHDGSVCHRYPDTGILGDGSSSQVEQSTHPVAGVSTQRFSALTNRAEEILAKSATEVDEDVISSDPGISSCGNATQQLDGNIGEPEGDLTQLRSYSVESLVKIEIGDSPDLTSDFTLHGSEDPGKHEWEDDIISLSTVPTQDSEHFSENETLSLDQQSSGYMNSRVWRGSRGFSEDEWKKFLDEKFNIRHGDSTRRVRAKLENVVRSISNYRPFRGNISTASNPQLMSSNPEGDDLLSFQSTPFASHLLSDSKCLEISPNLEDAMEFSISGPASQTDDFNSPPASLLIEIPSTPEYNPWRPTTVKSLSIRSAPEVALDTRDLLLVKDEVEANLERKTPSRFFHRARSFSIERGHLETKSSSPSLVSFIPTSIRRGVHNSASPPPQSPIPNSYHSEYEKSGDTSPPLSPTSSYFASSISSAGIDSLPTIYPGQYPPCTLPPSVSTSPPISKPPLRTPPSPPHLRGGGGDVPEKLPGNILDRKISRWELYVIGNWGHGATWRDFAIQTEKGLKKAKEIKEQRKQREEKLKVEKEAKKGKGEKEGGKKEEKKLTKWAEVAKALREEKEKEGAKKGKDGKGKDKKGD